MLAVALPSHARISSKPPDSSIRPAFRADTPPPAPPASRPTPQCGAADAALRVFREMRASGLQPDVVTYTSALTALQGAPNVRWGVS